MPKKRYSLWSIFSLLRKVAVIGAGYIAVELAGILNALGSQVSSLIRYDKVKEFTPHKPLLPSSFNIEGLFLVTGSSKF